jgi:hypothetical protein
MNVNGLGGAASLPLTLPSSPSSAGTGTTGPSGTSTGEVRMPGRTRSEAATAAAEAAKKAKEQPKLAPLPPLRGLTVAEIRAMLGVASPPGQLQTSAAGTSPSIISASLDRYT